MHTLKKYRVWLLSLALMITNYTAIFCVSMSSPINTPSSPINTPSSPINTPSSPINTPASPALPVEAPQSSPSAPYVPAAREQSINIAPPIKQRERYTQTEAFLQSEKLRGAILKTFYDDYEPVKHMDIVSRVMAKEAELRDTHWAFYHGLDNTWNVWQDVYTELYSHFNPSEHIEDNKFIFLRTRGKQSASVKDFLVQSLKEHGLVDDNNEAGGMLLSTNLSLFGNTGRQGRGECTWFYLMKDQKHRTPSEDDYKIIMDEFNLPYTYVDQCMKLGEFVQSKQQTLLQIFVPKNLVDDIGYVAWATGIPAQDKAIGWVQANVKNKTYEWKEDKPGRLWALEALKNKFKMEQEKNPMFRDMLKEIEDGAYSLNDYLRIFCNEPSKVPNMNTVQGRFLFSDKLLLNPRSGIKMFRHEGLEHSRVEQYRKSLNALIKNIIASKR